MVMIDGSSDEENRASQVRSSFGFCCGYADAEESLCSPALSECGIINVLVEEMIGGVQKLARK